MPKMTKETLNLYYSTYARARAGGASVEQAIEAACSVVGIKPKTRDWVRNELRRATKAD